MVTILPVICKNIIVEPTVEVDNTHKKSSPGKSIKMDSVILEERKTDLQVEKKCGC